MKESLLYLIDKEASPVIICHWKKQSKAALLGGIYFEFWLEETNNEH